ncbi:MAG: hypothetical protein WDZ74_01420 [Candidatus Paceibacterota bacterium]
MEEQKNSTQIDEHNNTSKETEVKNPDNKTVMGILAYLGPLVIVSYLTAKEDTFVRYHIRQGLVLLVILGVTWFIGITPLAFVLFPILLIINLAVLVLAVIGIMNVVNKKEKLLPLVGRFSSLFPL